VIELDPDDTMARLAAHSFLLEVVLGAALKGMPARERAEFSRAMQALARTPDPNKELPAEAAEAVRRVMAARAEVVRGIFDRAEAVAAEDGGRDKKRRPLWRR
jgi:hypothetical protein